jgi:O-antigen/teichoic acid export membrane protein
MVGDESYGMYFALFNFSMLLNIVLDLGITNYNNRNIAQHNYLLSKHLANIVGLKFMLAIVYAVFSLLTAAIIGYNGVQFHLLIFLILNQFLISFTLYLRSNISGLHLFRTDSLLSVLDRSIMIAICSLLLFTNILPFRFSIEWFVYAQSIAYGLSCLITFGILLHKSGKIRIRFQRTFFVAILRKSYPYALLVLLMSLYNRVDSVLLERLLPADKGREQAGIYAQAFRLLDAVSMFGVLFAGLLLPIFAKMIKQKQRLNEILKLSFSLIIVPAIIISVSSAYYSANIMDVLYHSNTQYSAKILGALMFAFIGIATTYIFGTLLTANGNMKPLNLMAIGGVVLNVVLNLVLIPQLFALGAAYACLITQIITALVQLAIATTIFKLKTDIGFIIQLLFFVGIVVILATLSREIENWILGYFSLLLGSVFFAFFIKVLNIKDLYKVIRYD